MNTKMTDKQDDLEDELQAILNLSEKLIMQQKIDVDKNWRLLHSRIHKTNQRQMFFKWIRNIAAILLFPLLGLSSYFYYQTTSLKSQPNEQLETMTAYGVKTKITLSDGSEVWLNSGSTLSYPQHFTGDKRQVQLSGEAFFKVKSDKKHRFDVRTKDDIIVSAYGTEFNIQAYNEESEVKMAIFK